MSNLLWDLRYLDQRNFKKDYAACSESTIKKRLLVNPRRMREGYGSRSVCLSACLLPY